MSSLKLTAAEQISSDGFAVIESVFDSQECRCVASELQTALANCEDERTALRRANGVIYGARNLLSIFPRAMTLWREHSLVELLTIVLGPGCGLVRGLYFDKPTDSNWSLPWHQDLTIAVQDHSRPSQQFRARTFKAGVPHVEAPDEVLRRMLTLRVHLDEVTDENGPLLVLPGTHVARDAAGDRPPVTILAAPGDVLAMRPLLSHASSASQMQTNRNRRVIHLEFAASRELPERYQWHEYIPLSDGAPYSAPRSSTIRDEG
jgi:hypothetical protein